MERPSGACTNDGWSRAAPILLIAATALLGVGLAGLLVMFPDPPARAPRVGRDFTATPLANAPDLRDVAEPITMIEGYYWSDGGSKGLTFRDARQVDRAVCLVNDLDDHHELTFGEVTPYFPSKVPIGGGEERAFLGMLQRWARSDPGALACRRRMDDGTKRWVQDYFSGTMPTEERARYLAIGLLRNLEARN